MCYDTIYSHIYIANKLKLVLFSSNKNVRVLLADDLIRCHKSENIYVVFIYAFCKIILILDNINSSDKEWKP